MLVELTVENIAIIEHARIEPGKRFTVMTGETGAGKSLLVDAIELALGERADSELVRAGATRATVAAVLDVSDSPDLDAWRQSVGLDADGAPLAIHRELNAEGRSQARVNGRVTPVSALRQLGSHLVDLHGQHDHQSLLDPARHVVFLDQWIGTPATELLARIGSSYAAYTEARQKLAALRSGLRDREHRVDLLSFQTKEIQTVAPRPGEMEELEAQLTRLKHIERLAGASAAAQEALVGGELNALDTIRAAVKSLEDVARFDSALDPTVHSLRSGLIQLEEGAHDLASYAEALDADPQLLEQVAGRIDDLRRLRRKYGDDEAAVLDFLQRALQELDMLSDAEASETDLVAALDQADRNLQVLSDELSCIRRERAVEFAERVQQQLRELAMERAEFHVSFRRRPPDAAGMDDVEFFFSANSGEPPRPLSKIASGGEISRVMLAIKTATAGKAGVPTLIFDEVDAGLGGKAAATVGRKLEELAQHCQVLVISHLPQIAARADTHYRIEKAERGGRVITQVRLLTSDERVEEIARMLAGDQVTESARAHAREMLATQPATV